MFNFIRYRKIYFVFSGLVITTAIVFLAIFGLRLGIEFTGGSILEVAYQNQRPENQEIRQRLEGLDLGMVQVQPTGEKGFIIRMKDITEKTHQKVLDNLEQEQESIEEMRFDLVGPTIGEELKSKTKIVTIVVLFSIVVYIALAFRRVQRPLKSWQYGIASLVALFHDTLIPLGLFAFLGKFYEVEITVPVITALLAVLGYSINNTVVVFDRIRENLFKGGESYEETVNKSLIQTLSRQINTSLTTLFVVTAIFFFGGETLKYFSLTLIAGIVAGTYSSIFLAGPFLVSWLRKRYMNSIPK